MRNGAEVINRVQEDTRLSRWGMALWLVFAIALLAVYYQQIWQVFQLGPAAWVRDNYSLQAAIEPAWQSLKYRQFSLPLPALGEAGRRAALALLGCGAVLLSAQGYGAGLLLLARIRLEEWGERLVYRTALGSGAIAYLSLGLAYLSRYSPGSVRAILGLGLLIGAGRLGYLLLLRSQEQGSRWFSPARLKFPNPAGKIWLAISLLAGALALATALAPEGEADALWYHLWLPRLWLEQGSPVDIVAEYISLYPLTWELLFGAAMAVGGPVAAKLLHFACLPLTGLAVYQLTRRFLPQASPWLAVALFVTVPTVLWEATTAYIDLALAFQVSLAIYALLRYLEARRRQWLWLAAISLGLALASKHLALVALLLMAAGLAFSLWRQDRDLRGALVPAILLGAFSLLLPLPWYLRSWAASGNPFFPDLYQVFGAFPPERWNDLSERGLAHFKDHFGHGRSLMSLLLLPWNMTVHGARYGGSLGPLFLLLLPGLFLRRRGAGQAPWLLAFVAGYLALWASPASSFQMRFLVPITPFLAALGAEAYARLAGRLANWRGATRLQAGLLAGLMLLNLPPFTSLHEADRVVWEGWLTHVVHTTPLGVVIGAETEDHYLGRKVASYRAWQYIDAHLPAEAIVLAFSGEDHFYTNRPRISSEATLAYPAVRGAPAGDEGETLRRMRQLGISHVLLSKRQVETGWLEGVALIQAGFVARWYDLEYEDGRFWLYRLRWEAAEQVYELAKGVP